jgi:hypothetical protein
LLFVFIYVGKVDNSKVSLRPVNEFGVEDFNSPVAGKYADNRRIDLTKTKSLAFLKHNIFATK